MALTICGVKTPQAPGRSTLLRPELMQLVPGHWRSWRNSQTPLFTAVLFWSIQDELSYRRREENFASVKLSTGKGIDYDSDSCYNDDW